MPFMTGVELAWQLHLERPDLPVVLVSGYGQLLSAEEIARAGVYTCVNKPFVIEEIATVLRQALKV
jgi:two-component system C4-dicarboxylate transport response regulator DctD